MHFARQISVFAIAASLAIACRPKAKPQQGAFVGMLAQLTTNPNAVKPRTTKDDKAATTYAYGDQPGIRKLELVVAKDRPQAWKMTFESAGGTLSPFTFEPQPDYGAMKGDTPKEWMQITGGPLKGAIAHLPGYIGSPGTPGDRCTAAEVFSPGFFLSAAFAFQESQMITWACDTGAAGVKSAITVSDFRKQCRDGLRAKTLRPGSADFDFVTEDVKTAADCTHAWRSGVTVKNAAGAAVRHDFMCVSTKSGSVDVRL